MTKRRTEIEQALRHAGRAAKQGDLSTADRWSKTAERLAAALDVQDAAEKAEAEAQRVAQELAEQMVCVLFSKVAYLAHAMVHAPMEAPAAFQNLIRLWRERNLGEGEADANRAAAKFAASKAAYLEGRFNDTLPDFVRERMDADWKKRREELANEPVVPAHWD
ncbi:MAG TPA: hypothetical protein VEF55_12370 [Candidatus Binatia bacterium]|nr:hypothetical protein [Candidatus Binatia bacterium]